MILKSLKLNDGNTKEKCFNLVVLMIKSFIIRKTSYYSDLIDKCLGNSKKLFLVIISLSKQKSSESLPPYEDPLILANEFGTFFGRKIEVLENFSA